MEIEDLKKVIEENLIGAEKKLKDKRYKIGEADNRNESRYISATRWALENEITMAEDEVIKLKEGLKELEKLKKMANISKKAGLGKMVKIIIGGKEKEFLITENFEEVNLGMLPAKLPLVAVIINKEAGEVVDFNGQKIKIINIF